MKIVSTVFTVGGAILLAIGLIQVLQTHSFLDESLETRGVVINLRWEYDSEGSASAYPVFQFVDERTGQEITVVSTHGSNPPSCSVGQEVYILYDPQNPYKAMIKSFWNIWLGSIIVTGLGAIFLSVGLTPFGFAVRRRRTVEYLKTQGEIVHGKVSGIYVDTSLRVQGEHPWRITVQWMNPASRKVHIFKSDHIWYNPSDFINIGDEIEVHMDPKNPKKHWINIDHLPQRAD